MSSLVIHKHCYILKSAKHIIFTIYFHCCLQTIVVIIQKRCNITYIDIRDMGSLTATWEDETSERFKDALNNKNDAAALALLKKKFDTCIPSALKISFYSSLMFNAITFERESVARALVSIGADINCLYQLDEEYWLSAAGYAALRGSACRMSICHRLGANMCAVIRKSDGSTMSALDLALECHKTADVVCYLLDEVHPERPVELSFCGKKALISAVKRENFQNVKVLFDNLKARQFDFRDLNKCPLTAGLVQLMTISDMMVMEARNNGQPALVRYLMKDLGLKSQGNKQELSLKVFNRLNPSASGKNGISRPWVALTKFECAACDAVAATKVCTGCRVVRYCSEDCSREHWKKNGGHKKVCKEIQRGASRI